MYLILNGQVWLAKCIVYDGPDGWESCRNYRVSNQLDARPTYPKSYPIPGGFYESEVH